MKFYMNGIPWKIVLVESDSTDLIDRTGCLTVGVTDPRTKTIYISNAIGGMFLYRVIIHELGHCTMWSYGLLHDIHRMTKREYRVEMEETICNILADYGLQIFQIAYRYMGERAIEIVPFYMQSAVI